MDNDRSTFWKNKFYFIAEHPMGAQDLWIEAANKFLPDTSKNGQPVRMHIEEYDKDWGEMKHDHTKFTLGSLSLEENLDLIQYFKKVPSTFCLSMVVYSDICADLQLLKNADEKVLVPTIWENLYRPIWLDQDLSGKILTAVQYVVDHNPDDYIVCRDFDEYMENPDAHCFHPEQLNLRISVEAAIQTEDNLPEWLKIVLAHHYIDEEGDGDAVGLAGFVKMIQGKFLRHRRRSDEKWGYLIANEKDFELELSFFELKIYFNDMGFDLAVEVIPSHKIYGYCLEVYIQHRLDYSSLLAYILDPHPGDIIMDFQEDEIDVAAHVFKSTEPSLYLNLLVHPSVQLKARNNVDILTKRMPNMSHLFGFIRKNSWSEVLKVKCRFKKVAKVIVNNRIAEETNWWIKDNLRTNQYLDNIVTLFEYLPINAVVIIITREEHGKKVTDYLEKKLKASVAIAGKYVLYDEFQKRWQQVLKYKKLGITPVEQINLYGEEQKQEVAQYSGNMFYKSSLKFDIERKEIFPKDSEDPSVKEGPSSSQVKLEEDVKTETPKNTRRPNSIELHGRWVEIDGKYAAIACNGRTELRISPPDEWYVKNWNGCVPGTWSPFSQAIRGSEQLPRKSKRLSERQEKPNSEIAPKMPKLDTDTTSATTKGVTKPTAYVQAVQKNTASQIIVPLVSPFAPIGQMASTSPQPVIQPLVDPLAGRYETNVNAQNQPGQPLPTPTTTPKARRWKPDTIVPPRLPNGFYELCVNPDSKGLQARIPRYQHPYYAPYFKTPHVSPTGSPPLTNWYDENLS